MSPPQLTYTSPNSFSLKQRLILATVPRLIASAFKCLYATARVEERGREHWDTLVASGAPFITGAWHETMGLAAAHHRNSDYHTLTSYSFDGELAARTVACFGLKSLRGSSSRGAMKALDDLESALDSVRAVGWTYDGPRGPRRKAKPGVALLAARAQAPILPFAMAASPRWRLNTWDRLIIPKPRARILYGYGEPIPPPEDISKEAVRATLRELESRLNALQAELEAELGEDAELDAVRKSSS